MNVALFTKHRESDGNALHALPSDFVDAFCPHLKAFIESKKPGRTFGNYYSVKLFHDPSCESWDVTVCDCTNFEYSY